MMTPFFTQFVLSHASNNTTSQNIGGDGCMGRSPPQIWWGPLTVPPVPLSLRPCLPLINDDKINCLNFYVYYLYCQVS